MYAGYVDDPRNTDNAWMETVAYNFHDDSGNSWTHPSHPLLLFFDFLSKGDGFSKLKLHAGDDAGDVAWTEAREDTKLYASHSKFIENTVKLRAAAW